MKKSLYLILRFAVRVIKTVSVLVEVQTHRWIEQNKDHKLDTYKYGQLIFFQLIFDKGVKTMEWKKDRLNLRCCSNWTFIGKNELVPKYMCHNFYSTFREKQKIFGSLGLDMTPEV